MLRSCVREFLASEAMAALRVPTTRCLCVVATGDGVVRQWYGEDGRERVLNEPGAVGTRVARSYLRFGQMELFTQRGDLPLLQALCLLWPYLLWLTCRRRRHTPFHTLRTPPPPSAPRRTIPPLLKALISAALGTGETHGCRPPMIQF